MVGRFLRKEAGQSVVDHYGWLLHIDFRVRRTPVDGQARHPGGCGTVHANAAADVPARLEALGTAAGLDRAALHSQLAAALAVVIHLVRDGAGRRRLAEIHVLERDAAGLVVTVPALRWAKGAFAAEVGWERLRALVGDAL